MFINWSHTDLCAKFWPFGQIEEKTMNGKINRDQTNGKGACTTFTFDTQIVGDLVKGLVTQFNWWKAKPLVYLNLWSTSEINMPEKWNKVNHSSQFWSQTLESFWDGLI